MNRLHLVKESIVASTCMTAIVMLFGMVPIPLELIRPIQQEFEDFDIYDMFYSGKDSVYSHELDPDIILIQADRGRAGILHQLEILRTLQPAVIGIDFRFRVHQEPLIDSLLMDFILNDDSIVVGYSIEGDKKQIGQNLFDTGYLRLKAGYLNFSSKDSLSLVRSFAPFYKDEEKEYLAFATQILRKYSYKRFLKLCSRNNSTEFINYRGGLGHFISHTVPEFEGLLADKQLNSITGKIVLLGFFSAATGDAKAMDDLKFTPLNPSLNGRGFPDSYGIVIHANIINMLLKRDYILKPPVWMSFLITFLTGFLCLWYIIYCHWRIKHPSHIRIFIFQLVYTIIVIYLTLLLFKFFNIRLSLPPMVLIIVLSGELFDVYKKLAKILHQKVGYQTLFSTAKSIVP